MVTANWFVTATEARNNIVKDIAVHGEISAVEMEIMRAVQRGDYQVTVSGESPITMLPATASKVFTVDVSSNTIQVLMHGFSQGDIVTVYSTSQLPAPLQALTYYYVIYVDADHIKLAATRADALANRPIPIDIALGVGAINIIQSGSGYVTAPLVRITGGSPRSDAQAVAHLNTRGRLESITVLDGGSGFTRTPDVQVTSPGSGASAGAIRFKVTSITGITFGGSSYNVGDTLTLISGSGSPAASVQVTQVNGGAVTQVVLINSGSYLSTQLPNLTGSSTSGSGVGSGCSLNLSMGILSVSVGTGGLSYAQPPLVTVQGGGGTNATVQAQLSGGIVSAFIVTNPGSGYISTPNMIISNGTGATAVVQLRPTVVSRVDVLNNGGSIYVDVPTVTFTTPGGGATVQTVYMKVIQTQIRSLGQNYQVNDQLYVSGGAGTQNAVLQVTAITPGGGIQSVQIVNGGSYTALPVLQNNPVYSGTGQNAFVDISMGVDKITLSSGGTGYQVPPNVIIDSINIISGGPGNPSITTPGNSYRVAKANSRIIAGVVTSVDIIDPGLGYDIIPDVSLSCGFGAAGIAILVPTGVANVRVVDPGSGYVDPPGVVITGGGGAGAQAEASISNGQVTLVTVTDPGFGYTSLPEVVIEGNAQGRASLIDTPLDRIELLNGGYDYVLPPTVVIQGGQSQAVSVLQTTSVSQVNVTATGEGYASDPVITFVIPLEETGFPVLPIVRAQRSFAVAEVVITSAGDDYQSTPSVMLNSPLSTGTQATAVAVLSAGQGLFYVRAYEASQDYWKVNCGLTPSGDLLVRPYKDQIASVKKYFDDLGYSTVLETNPTTGTTLQWTIRW
jgi:hypothetical protein